VIHTTLVGLEPATFRSLVDCWSDALPVVPPTQHVCLKITKFRGHWLRLPRTGLFRESSAQAWHVPSRAYHGDLRQHWRRLPVLKHVPRWPPETHRHRCTRDESDWYLLPQTCQSTTVYWILKYDAKPPHY